MIADIAAQCGRTPAQIILRWHVQIGNVAIPKSITSARIEENFNVFDFELEGAQLAAIEALDRGQRPARPTEVPMSRLVRIVIAVAVLGLPAAAGAIIIKPTYVTNCHEAVYKPRSITLSCGDASTLLRKLSWTRWRANSANGNGQYAVNPCNPNCAAGKFKSTR